MGRSPILGSFGGRWLADSLESRFLLLELIVVLWRIEVQLSQRATQFLFTVLDVGYWVQDCRSREIAIL
jgi:hypothetical protein